MARILQIRRGTAAQNNNFTGMPGEVTVDTDTHTLRVHDGTTLGGFALARADMQNADTGASTFDITTVSDEFWTELFKRFGAGTDSTGTSITVLTGRDADFRKSTYLDYSFSTPLTPFYATCVLVCQTADAGYSVGEEVSAYGFGDISAPGLNIFRDASGMHVRLMMGSQQCWVCNRNTGVRTDITYGSWVARFRLYC